jgi:HD-like signal output (HDOD) protein
MSVEKSLIEQINEDIKSGSVALPALEKMAVGLNQTLSREDVNIKEVAALIERDPSLSTRVLNLANSAAYSGLVKMRSIERAIIRVGLKPVRSFFMTSALKDIFKGRTPLLKEVFNIWWKHSLCCALGNRKIAMSVNQAAIAEDAYLLGLLHDIGTIVILSKLNEMRFNGNEPVEINEDLLKEMIDTFHAQVGGVILRKLAFDEEFCHIVETHHQPDSFENPDNPLFNILQVENAILRKTGVAVNPDPDISVTSLPSTARLGLDPVFIAVEEVDIEEEFKSMDALLT